MTNPIRQLDDESLRILREMVGEYKRRRAPERPTKRRYPRGISPNTQYYGVTLLEDVGETTAGEVSATIYEMDFSTEVESTATVLDNGGIFEGGEEGANGIAVKIGDDYHLIQLGCAE